MAKRKQRKATQDNPGCFLSLLYLTGFAAVIVVIIFAFSTIFHFLQQYWIYLCIGVILICLIAVILSIRKRQNSITKSADPNRRYLLNSKLDFDKELLFAKNELDLFKSKLLDLNPEDRQNCDKLLTTLRHTAISFLKCVRTETSIGQFCEAYTDFIKVLSVLREYDETGFVPGSSFEALYQEALSHKAEAELLFIKRIYSYGKKELQSPKYRKYLITFEPSVQTQISEGTVDQHFNFCMTSNGKDLPWLPNAEFRFHLAESHELMRYKLDIQRAEREISQVKLEAAGYTNAMRCAYSFSEFFNQRELALQEIGKLSSTAEQYPEVDGRSDAEFVAALEGSYEQDLMQLVDRIYNKYLMALSTCSTYEILYAFNYSSDSIPTIPSNVANYAAARKDDLLERKKTLPVQQPPSFSVEMCDQMDGIAFEKFCASLLRLSGYGDVELTKTSGDQGVDIIATKDGIRYAIQCKCYSSNLGNKPVQEVYAGKSMYQCHVGVVMTNQNFTSGAIELANTTGVLLWGRDKLEKMIECTPSLRQREPMPLSPTEASSALPESFLLDSEGDDDSTNSGELFPQAVDIVLETGMVSVSMLQRRLNLGYSRAARLVDQMEERGIVGPFEGAKPRKILITKEQWQSQSF